MEDFPLGHVEAPANRNEKELVEQLLEEVLGEDLEVELVAGDSSSSPSPSSPSWRGGRYGTSSRGAG